MENIMVFGQLKISFCLEVQDSCTETALKYAETILNTKAISVVHGDIHTWSGNEYPLISRNCHVEWFDAIKKSEYNE